MKHCKVMFAANTSWYLYNFRKEKIKYFVSQGCEVFCIAPSDRFSEKLESLGAHFISLDINRKGQNPFAEFALVLKIVRIVDNFSPGIVFTYTPKINIYFGLACTLLRRRFVPNVSGLGTAFISQNLITKLVTLLYKISFFKANHVFFQNTDDRDLFITKNLVNVAKVEVLPGSGVDLENFSYVPMKNSGESFTFLMIARLLRDKGINEFVGAAKLIKEKYPNVCFKVLGPIDKDNKTAITQGQIDEWQKSGFVEYLGISDDVRSEIIRADCIVLPSYREGLPRVLLEASAIGRPIITTNVPGCRHAIENLRNGILCEPRSITSLAECCERMLALPEVDIKNMGKQSRIIAEKKYCHNKIIDRYWSVCQEYADS